MLHDDLRGGELDVSVVLPVYRTAAMFDELCDRLVAALTAAELSFELVFVDDGSPDDAWKRLSARAASDPRVVALRLSRNFGQHPAIGCGFEHARGSAVVLMDADLQDRPEDVPLLVGELGGDVDVVYTTKKGEPESLVTRLSSGLFHWTFSKVTGTRVPERIGTFRAFTRRFLRAVLSYPERGILYGPVMFHIGFTMAVVEVEHGRRPEGKSSYTLARRLKLALDSLLAYTDIPQRMLLRLGGVTLVAAALYSVALIGRWLWLGPGNAPPGITLLALLVTAGFGCTMVALGVLGMYVWRVYQEVLGRPRYVVARALNVRGGPGEAGIRAR